MSICQDRRCNGEDGPSPLGVAGVGGCNLPRPSTPARMDHRRDLGRAGTRRRHRRGGRHELADSSVVDSTGMGSEGVPEKLAAQRHSWTPSLHRALRSVDLRARGIPAIVVARRRRIGGPNRHRSSPDPAAACPHHPLPGPRTIGNDVRSVRGRSPVSAPGAGRAVLRRRPIQDRPTGRATHNRRTSQSGWRVSPRPALVTAHMCRCACACRIRRLGDRDAARLKRVSRRARRDGGFLSSPAALCAPR